MIFFDLDGTLLDHKLSEYSGVKAFYIENKQHFSIDENEFYQLWCNLSEKNFKRYLDGEISFRQQRIIRLKELFSSVGLYLRDSEAEIKFKFYLFHYEKNWKPFDDVIPCLESLENCRLGIISNGNHDQQLLKLERMGIEKYFETIITSGLVGAAKPDIKIFQTACERANLSPENCYYIGDDLETDILSCKKTGINGIWLNRKREKLTNPDVKMIYNLDELVRNL